MKTINIGLLGLGTVGEALVSLINSNGNNIFNNTGCDLQIKTACVKNINKQRKVNLNLVTDLQKVINDPKIDTIVEVIGGTDESLIAVKQALQAKKSVVTANKALIAIHGRELFSIARQNSVKLGFEAAVCAGLPIIKVIKEGLVANKVTRIIGILNGTSNYILSSIESKGISFKQALLEAQEKGYAETDPSLDLNGHDTAHKLAILSSICFMANIDYKDISITGIEQIKEIDIQVAKLHGFSIKLLGESRLDKNIIQAEICPALVATSKINGTLNVVEIDAQPLGCTSYVGPGAGGLETASALVSDLVAENSYHPKLDNQYNLMKIQDSKHYIRFTSSNDSTIKHRLSNQKISFEELESDPLIIIVDSVSKEQLENIFFDTSKIIMPIRNLNV